MVAPTLAVRAVQPVIAGLRELGHDLREILDGSGIVEAQLIHPDGRVPGRAMAHVWTRARELSGDEDIGMHVALAAPVASFELPAHAILASPTLRDAYRRATRYQRLIHEANDLSFAATENEGVLRHELPGGRPAARQPAEFLAATWLRFGRLVTGTEWMPSRVRFAHPEPDDASEHRRLFGHNTQFSSGLTALHVAANTLDTPNARADANLALLLDRYAESLIEKAPVRKTVSARVRAWIERHLGELAPTASDAAAELHMSTRTLHRTLKGEGTSYRDLLDQFRRERAAALLDDPRVAISEVAFLLGFSDLSAFYRAFKRWTGKTPADSRR